MSRRALDAVKVTESTLPGGVKVRFKQVPLAILDAISQKFRIPDPPMVEIEEKSEPGNPWMEENPNDPDYHIAVEQMNRDRGTALIDAMTIMGVELVDPVPDTGWLDELAYVKKITGIPDLTDYDLEDPTELEFVYKKFYAIGRDGMEVVMRETGVTEEGIDNALDSFPSDEERSPDTDA